jgi:hypothetical protein
MEKRRDLGKNERKTKVAERGGERRQQEAVLFFNIQ